jgi:hypothetical protein
MKPFNTWVLPAYFLLLAGVPGWHIPQPFLGLIMPRPVYSAKRC